MPSPPWGFNGVSSNGGNGLPNAIAGEGGFGTPNWRTGVGGNWFAGGGAGAYFYGNGFGGAGGGGLLDVAGLDNTGGGGASGSPGQPGGSGVVIVRYKANATGCTGGVVTTYGSKTIHIFKSDDTFTVTPGFSKTVEYVVVGGGGGGGQQAAGGGGGSS